VSGAYTHDDHARRCVVDTFRGHYLGLRVQYVQARIGRTVCCARIVDAFDTPDGVEMWKLDLQGPIHGRVSAPARNVRQCQGIDGTCACAPADPSIADGGELRPTVDGKRSAAAVGAALAAPDGNHGENDFQGTAT